jgi:hypothetical protein
MEPGQAKLAYAQALFKMYKNKYEKDYDRICELLSKDVDFDL